MEVVNECKYDGAFTFIYSQSESTPHSKMEDNVTEEEKKNRLARLNELVNKYYLENNDKLVGTNVLVLIENCF